MSIARQTALRHNAGVMSEYLNPVHSDREALVRQGQKPKDHHRQNLEILKEIQNTRRRMEDQASPPKELFKMPRFLKVESKIKEAMQEPNPETQRPRTDSNRLFLRAHCHTRMPEAPDPSEIRPKSSHREKKKPPVPSAAEVRPPSPQSRRDYIRANAMSVIAARVSKSSEEEGDICRKLNPNYAKVPDYILNRREELRQARAADMAEMESAQIPPGMRVLPEEERLETLSVLQQARDQRLRELQNQRLVLHTPSQIQFAHDVQTKLDEIDAAIKVFSRKRIVVKDDSYTQRPSTAPSRIKWR